MIDKYIQQESHKPFCIHTNNCVHFTAGYFNQYKNIDLLSIIDKYQGYAARIYLKPDYFIKIPQQNIPNCFEETELQLSENMVIANLNDTILFGLRCDENIVAFKADQSFNLINNSMLDIIKEYKLKEKNHF